MREAEDKEPVAAGTVNFAPPDYHLLLERGPQLALSADDLVNFSRPSIDVLFESAADVYRERLMGIILTGGNNDGAAGLEAVHRAGGITVVQQPDTAQVPQMVVSPCSACPQIGSCRSRRSPAGCRYIQPEQLGNRPPALHRARASSRQWLSSSREIATGRATLRSTRARGPGYWNSRGPHGYTATSRPSAGFCPARLQLDR